MAGGESDFGRNAHSLRVVWFDRGDGGLSFSFTGSAFASKSQGQYRKAATVKVVSKELENVLTETYHCQGLHSVMTN
jgi:hypothetical protein